MSSEAVDSAASDRRRPSLWLPGWPLIFGVLVEGAGGLDVLVVTASGWRRWVCRWDRRVYRWAGGAVGIGDCVVSCLLGVSGVMTSQDTGGVGLPGGRAAAWACRRGPAR